MTRQRPIVRSSSWAKTDEVQLFTERHEHSGKVEVEETPLDDLTRARRIAFILYRAGQMVDGKETDANDHTQQ
jgi:homoserine acetyltransferase